MKLPRPVESGALRVLMALPPVAQRRLFGRPLRYDDQVLATDVQLMLRLQRLSGHVGAEEQDIPAGREQILHDTALVAGDQPIGEVRDLEVAGLPARHYVPTGWGSSPGPLLVFFHGGGFLYGDLDSHDAACRVLAERGRVPVLAIDYGLAPENPFPGPFDDAEAAVRWVEEHADELGTEPDRIAVGGDSAGGNLAAWVAIAAAREGRHVAWQLLIYPCTDPQRATESLHLFGEELYLTRRFMDRVNSVFLPDLADRENERVDLLRADLPDGLAPALVVTAGFDPLRDEGEAYAERLAAHGVPVEQHRYADQIHGFLNVVGVGRSSPAAVHDIAARVRRAIGDRQSVGR